MSSYGEMLVLTADGMVTPAAHDAFAAALAKDPNDDVSRFYLAFADAQAGKALAAEGARGRAGTPRQRDGHRVVACPGGKIDELQFLDHLRGNVRKRRRLDDYAEDRLSELLG